jgi:hypothetical protein
LVTPYLLKLLWLPSLILACLIIAGGFWGKYLISLNKRWKLKIIFESDDTKEEQICYLKNQQKIAIGDDNLNSIFCPGDQPRGYLQRKGNKLILIPNKAGFIFYREQEVTKVKAITVIKRFKSDR